MPSEVSSQTQGLLSHDGQFLTVSSRKSGNAIYPSQAKGLPATTESRSQLGVNIALVL